MFRSTIGMHGVDVTDDGSRWDRAEELFASAESFPGAVPLEIHHTVLRLSTQPSSWMLQRPKDGKAHLRRVEWDAQRDPLADWNGPRTFCADAQIEESTFLGIINSLRDLKCPLVGEDYRVSLVLTSASTRNVEYVGGHAVTKLSWLLIRSGPWDDLEIWFRETVELLEAQLPVSTVAHYRYEAGLR